ncbi:Elongation factor 3B [Symbiodinium microadriaticum]|uniref:Elongation factor 3B n=1 Tax=Symbiodinium microadriaticum TaxID=2951 RepID=A0A1Q9D6W5_SYMMI|nr:Elongation factor 3B [Symbiodinium microadriaticum]
MPELWSCFANWTYTERQCQQLLNEILRWKSSAAETRDQQVWRRRSQQCLVSAAYTNQVGALRLLALMRDEAADAAKVLFECAQNKDLDPYLDEIIKVSQLSEIVFVQSASPSGVETPALAIVMPLIVRGLKDRDERTKRRALVIADNMCKLVPDVTEIQPFLPTPQLIPLVEKSTHNISDPEVRNVATRCYRTLQTADKVLNLLQEKIPDEKTQLARHIAGGGGRGRSQMRATPDKVSELVADYVASLCTCISAAGLRHVEALSTQSGGNASRAVLMPDLLESCYDAAEGDDALASKAVEDLDEEGEDLCNCVFTLGYGVRPNDCGKSTLLRAINNEQVDGFPPKSELVTAFVEHGIGEKEPECELTWTPLEYIFADETIQAMGVTTFRLASFLGAGNR